METILLTLYVLVWPVIVLAVLGILVKGFIVDWRQARRDGESLI
ncbi:putative transporter small subunit [Nesterenkonia sedimenti]|nr:putative transporter small subunit [Nesterenkonia sedimenti]